MVDGAGAGRIWYGGDDQNPAEEKEIRSTRVDPVETYPAEPGKRVREWVPMQRMGYVRGRHELLRLTCR